MGRYVDKDSWEEEILIPDTHTPILGGQPVWEGDRLIDGFANVSAAVLADRTRYLKNKLDGIEIGLDSNFENFVRKDNNLSDLEDIQQAKYNLELNLVDNTRDLDKPVSNATQEALDEKVDLTDPRLSDSRTPKGSAGGVLSGSYPNPTFAVDMATQAELDAVAATKVDKVAGKGLSDENYTLAEKNKLGGIEAGATKNATDAQLRDRTTHTGTQPISSVTNLQSSLDSKVDKQAGYGLSQENYTPAEKSKLASIEGSKFKGEYVSLAALQAAHPSPEVGSYAYVDLGVGEVVSKYIWDSSDTEWVKQQGEAASLTPAEIKSLYEGNPDTNAFTDSEKTKLAGVQAGAQVNSVTSVAGKTGAVVVTKADVGLSNVDNTSDANKPVSTAQQAALNLKLDTAEWYLGTDKQYTANATGTVDLDLAAASIFDLTLTGNTTLAVNNATAPLGETRSVVVRIRQGATAQTLTWWAGITWLTNNGLAPDAPAADKIREYILSYDGENWIGRGGSGN